MFCSSQSHKTNILVSQARNSFFPKFRGQFRAYLFLSQDHSFNVLRLLTIFPPTTLTEGKRSVIVQRLWFIVTSLFLSIFKFSL